MADHKHPFSGKETQRRVKRAATKAASLVVSGKAKFNLARLSTRTVERVVTLAGEAKKRKLARRAATQLAIRSKNTKVR